MVEEGLVTGTIFDGRFTLHSFLRQIPVVSVPTDRRTGRLI